MKKINVISMGEFRDLKEGKKSEEAYSLYLKTLGNGQLENEVNFLLSECSDEDETKDLYSRSRLLLKEIGSRASGSLKLKIEIMHDNL